jgi:signal transduction histidine kinase
VPQRTSDGRFRAMIESCSQIVSLLDREGRVAFMSSGLQRLLGREIGGCEGRGFLECVGSEDRPVFERLLAACLVEPPAAEPVAGSGLQVPPEPPEIDCRHQNGERRRFELQLVNRLADPALGAILCMAQDVTERGRVQGQLLALDRIASVGLLAAGVAHEINNPLAAIVTSLELAAHRLAGKAGGELAEDIRSAREASERVRQIVRDLKVFSRSDDDRRTVVDVEALLDTSARIAGNEIRHRARVEKHYGKVPPVYANESRLGQVFLNLLINAVEATGQPSPAENPPAAAGENIIHLTTRLDPQGRVLVEVADSGPRIPGSMRDRLFAPFAAKGSGASPGLGLTICQRIVQELGGEISIESHPAGGNVFRVSLPPTGPGLFRPGPPLLETPRPVRRGRVLVIDDEPTIATAIARTLAVEHDVITETRAAEALSRLRRGERFDVIFCDLMMPQMTGMDLHRTLVAELPEQAVRMIFLTGGAFTPGARRFLEEVPNLRIEKPFDTRLLRTIVSDRVS